MDSLTHEPGTIKSKLSLLERLTLLVYHYFTGPIFGVWSKLIVYDRKYAPYECVEAIGIVCCIITVIAYRFMSVPVRVGLLLILSSTLIYAVTPIAQTVLEYRAYLSTAGVALILAYFISLNRYLIPVSLALVVFYFIQSRRRIKLFTDPLLFWRQASDDCLKLAGTTYLYETHCHGRFQGLDRVVHLLLDDNLPQTAGEWLNANQWATLDQSRIRSAAELLARMVYHNPTSADVWRNLGVVRYYLSRDVNNNVSKSALIDAESSFMSATALDPSDALSWLGLGQCYVDQGDFKNAELCLQTSLELAPDSVFTRMRYLEILERNTNVEEFKRIDSYFRDRNTIYVTPDMLTDELRDKYNQQIGERNAKG